jgi:hypothetical protein
MTNQIKSNIPLVQEQEHWNGRNVVIQSVCILAVAMLAAYLAGVYELPPITSLLLGLTAGFFASDALSVFFPLKTWEVRHVSRAKL